MDSGPINQLGQAARSGALLCVSIGMLMLLGACGGGGGGDNASGPNASGASAAQVSSSASRPVAQSDAEIAALIYSDTQRTPTGFYSESAPAFNGYVSTSHLKNTDVAAGSGAQYELCTDDFNQALQWSETANANGVNANLVGNDATDRYFEFDRVRNGTPQGYLRSRIYKCAYLNRDTVDLRSAQGVAGVLHVQPLDAAALKSVSEYLWQFTTYNNYGNVVLSSTGGGSGATLTHALFIATLSAGIAPACDTIDVIEWKHTLNAGSGAMQLSIASQWSFQARYSNGAVALCN